MKKMILFVLFGGFFLGTSGQAFVKSGEGADDFQWRMTGRALFDAGTFIADTSGLGNGVVINDLRIGAIARIMNDWTLRVEVGFSGSKVGIKDVFVNYAWGANSVRAGHYFEPFAIDYRLGTTDYRLMTMTATDRAFGDRRKLGVSYTYNVRPWSFSGGIFSDGDVDNLKTSKEGYSLAAKLIGRPVFDEDKLIHLGISSRFSTHDKFDNGKLVLAAGAPTAILPRSQNDFIRAEVSNVINQWRVAADVISYYKKWYLQGQYIWGYVNRYGADNFNGKGGYVQVGYLVRGEHYNYNQETGFITNPSPKSLEVLCRYNVTTLNDESAGIMGGCQNDISVGANYYFNRYVAVKFDYVHMILDKYAVEPERNLDLIQARLQLNF